MAGTARTHPGWARIAAAAIAAALLALALFGGRAAIAPETASAQGCSLPSGLAPIGPGPARFTMMVRVNTQANVDAYKNFNSATGGLGGRIRQQDIFVLNTRFLGNQSGTQPPMTQTVAADLATQLRAAFPCNRIVALTGLSFDPFSAGFAYTLFDHPAVYALISDWEPMDWDQGRATAPGRPSWNQKYKVSLKRIKGWLSGLSGTLAAYPNGAAKRAGLVPIDDGSWNYGEIAQAIDKKNRRLGGRHLGPQSVMTQDSCADGGPTAFGSRAKEIIQQYRYKLIRKKVFRKGKKRTVMIRRKLKKRARPNLSNLALQISFSAAPSPSGGMALTKTSAATADACVSAGLKKGGGAFFFFASDDAMALLFQQPRLAVLRPALSSSRRG